MALVDLNLCFCQRPTGFFPPKPNSTDSAPGIFLFREPPNLPPPTSPPQPPPPTPPTRPPAPPPQSHAPRPTPPEAHLVQPLALPKEPRHAAHLHLRAPRPARAPRATLRALWSRLVGVSPGNLSLGETERSGATQKGDEFWVPLNISGHLFRCLAESRPAGRNGREREREPRKRAR